MKKGRPDRIKMIVDWTQCIRVVPGEERLFAKSTPYKCFVCSEFGDYNGLLIFEGDPIPECREHGPFRPTRRHVAAA